MSKKRRKPKEQFHYDPPYEPESAPNNEPKYKTKLVYLIDPAEVNALIAASEATYVDVPTEPSDLNYSTYTEEEVQAIMNGGLKRKRKRKSTLPETK